MVTVSWLASLPALFMFWLSKEQESWAGLYYLDSHLKLPLMHIGHSSAITYTRDHFCPQATAAQSAGRFALPTLVCSVSKRKPRIRYKAK